MAFTPLTLMLKAWLFLSLHAIVSAQTFAEYPLSNTWPGISPACLTALNTTVDCSGLLPVSAENHQPRLNAENLTSLCTASCLASLNNAKATIQAACTLATDVIPLDSGTYPATYLVDLFTYTYGINCRRDSTTEQYCDVLFGQWLNQPSLTAAQACSDCWLGITQMQLNSPFGYDDDFASDFASLTSSCSKTGYAFTSPPPYTTTATGTLSSAPSTSSNAVLDPGCVSLYTIQAGDTCNSIALAQNVSTWAVYGSSGIADCSNLPTGSKLCLLGQCLLHQVQETETCDSIIAAAGVTVSPAMFVAWNPNINPVCSNLHTLVGNYICLSRPAGLLTPNITLTDATALATATAWPGTVPTDEQLPIAPGTLTACTEYTNYRDATIQDSFYQPMFPLYTETVNECYYVALANGILLGDLLSWNPILSRDESNCTLAAGYSYCVGFGNSTGISPPPSSACINVESSIIVPGTTPSCSCYTKYSGLDDGFLSCEDLADTFKITVATLQDWNPWLGSDCDADLFANLTGGMDRALCIRNGTKPATPTSTRSATYTPTSSSSAPATPTTPGTVCTSGTDTGNPNQTGLCSFACHYGYCPVGPCVCLAYGAQVPEPPLTGVAGYPLAGLDDSYIDLCSYVYNHGYYPTGACTSNPDGSPQI